MYYLPSCVWLISPNKSSRLIHIVTNARICFSPFFNTLRGSPPKPCSCIPLSLPSLFPHPSSAGLRCALLPVSPSGSLSSPFTMALQQSSCLSNPALASASLRIQMNTEIYPKVSLISSKTQAFVDITKIQFHPRVS